MSILNNIYIERFRHIQAIEFNFGRVITMICGPNGTGKTSILGLIGHIFTYDKATKTLFNSSFYTQFSDVFKFSPQFDKGGQHKYKLIFDDGSEKEAISRDVIEKGRSRFRIDVGLREFGKGKIDKPVIYLGLKRLIPVAQENEKNILLDKKKELDSTMINKYNEWYKKVFVSANQINPVHLKSINKEFYTPNSSSYDTFGISAGQDTVGQIIIALLSFYQLKTVENNYQGGILLIDEIEATLHPAAQKNLIDLLLSVGAKLNLQIIFTTHSTDIIKFILLENASKFEHNTKHVYLDNNRGFVSANQDRSILNYYIADLNNESVPKSEETLINVYLEDAEAKLFFKYLIKPLKLTKKIKIQNVKLGCNFYKSLLQAKFPEFKKSIIVLDGDAISDFKKFKSKNLLFLPGELRVENQIKNLLDTLEPDNKFWSQELGGYTRNVFLQNSKDLIDKRDEMKKWFVSEKKYWGRGACKVFELWAFQNGESVKTFQNNLTNIFSHFERTRV